MSCFDSNMSTFWIGTANAIRGVVNAQKYLVLAANSQADLERDGASVEFGFDTLKEAKERAKYYLTDEYRQTSEASCRLGYSQVKDTKTGEVKADYFNNIGLNVPECE